MAFKTTTRTGYGQRVGNSAKGIGAGVLMFVLGTILLFTNEGCFVKQQKTLNEAQGKTRRIDSEDIKVFDEELQGKLIHASAFADTKDELADEMFGINVVAIALERKVEYLQWREIERKETEDNLGGSQTTTTYYEYKKEWVKSPVDSSAFKDIQYKNANTVLAKIEAQSQRAANVSFGAYKLPRGLVADISGSIPAAVVMTPELEALNAKLGGGKIEAPAVAPPVAVEAPSSFADEPEQLELMLEEEDDAPAPVQPSALSPQLSSFVHIIGNNVYIGKNPDSEAIGDVRVTLTKIMPADVSILAQVNNKTFEKFISSTGNEFWRLEMGTKSAAAMYASAHKENSVQTWILRVIGTLLVIGGLKGIFGVVTTLLKVLPFLANIVGAGIGLICFVGGLAWSFLVISLAWLFYRPVVGVPLLVVAAAGIWYLKKVAKEKKAAGTDGAPAAK